MMPGAQWFGRQWFQTPPLRLAVWFAASLLVFLALRWQPLDRLEGWLGAQLARQVAQAGVQLRWRSLDLDGAGLALEGVRLTRARGTLSLTRLEVQPAWQALVHGRLAARLRVRGWNGMDGEAEALVWREGARIRLADASLRLQASALAPLIARQAPLAATPEGEISATGALWLDAATGRPLAGAIEARWQDAALAAAGFGRVALGGYRLHAAAEQARQGLWHWRLSGGEALKLQAEGTLDAAGSDPARWRLAGAGRAGAGAGAPPMLKAMLAHGARFHIEGPLWQPRLRLQ